MEYIINLTEEEEKVLKTDMISIQEWIENAIKEKARRTTDRIILEHTDKNPKKILQSERNTIIQDLVLETAKERNDRLEAEMKAKN